MAVSSTTTLGCGRTIDHVWETIGSPADPHQRDCPDCRAARRDLRALRQATVDLQHEDDQQEPGPGLLDRVMQVARSEVRRGRRIPLHRPGSWDHGDGLSVSEQAVVAVARRAAEDEPDVQVRRCSVDLGDDGADGADAVTESVSGSATGDGLPSQVALTLRISVAATTVIPDATARLRATVHHAVEAGIGVTVTAVHVIVEDVHDIAIDDSATGADDDPA